MKSLILRLLPGFLLPLVKRIETSPVGYRLVRGAFWSLLGTVVARSLSVLASIFVARVLGKEGFGELGIIQSTVLNFSVFVGCGFGVTATKHIAEFKTKDPEMVGRIMSQSGLVAAIAGGIMALMVIAFAPWLATQVLAAPHLANLLRMGSIVLFLSAFNGYQNGALSGFEAFRAIARVNLLSGLATFPFMVGGVYLGGLLGAVWGLIASATLMSILSQLALRDETRRASVPFCFRKSRVEWKVLFGFSMPAVLAISLMGVGNWICSAILVNQVGGYAEMGIFNATNQWFALILFLPSLLKQVLLPILAESHGNRDQNQVRRTLGLAFKVNMAIVGPCMVILILASSLIMSFYGPEFAGAWPVLVISILTAGVIAMQSPAGELLNARGSLWVVFFLNFLWVCLFAGLTLYLAKRGALGLVNARLIAYAIQTLCVFWVVARFLRMREGAH